LLIPFAFNQNPPLKVLAPDSLIVKVTGAFSSTLLVALFSDRTNEL